MFIGHSELYEVAKPYVTTFFETCSQLAEFLTIWMFVWQSKIRRFFVCPPEKLKKKSPKDPDNYNKLDKTQQ